MTYSFTLESIVMPYLIKYQEKINVRVFYINMYHFKDFQDSQLKDCELKPRKSLARLEPGSARPQPRQNHQVKWLSLREITEPQVAIDWPNYRTVV